MAINIIVAFLTIVMVSLIFGYQQSIGLVGSVEHEIKLARNQLIRRML